MKNTDRLEEFVRSHREEFDVLEPSPKVWDAISKNDKKVRTVNFRRNLLRIAAVVAIVAITSAILINNPFFLTPGISEISDPEIKELIETEAFYSSQVNGKLKEIRKCYAAIPELEQEIEGDLFELESMYKDLKNDLRENVANKAVIEAMIENNRYRLKLVDSVLDQINC